MEDLTKIKELINMQTKMDIEIQSYQKKMETANVTDMNTSRNRVNCPTTPRESQTTADAFGLVRLRKHLSK